MHVYVHVGVCAHHMHTHVHIAAGGFFDAFHLTESGTGYFSQVALGNPCSHLPHSWIRGGQPSPLSF